MEGSGMKQFFKIALGGACALALVMTFALGRSTPPAPVVAADPPGFDETWNDSVKIVELKTADMKNTYRQIDMAKAADASSLPRSVASERVMPDAPAKMPPVVRVHDADDERPAVKRKRERHASVERNVCTRHHMRKIEINGGKSWRCKR
jgi:hypothetical protein